jgi:hypothetical protein
MNPNLDPESLTYFDAVGVERWRDGDKIVNQNSPFRKAPSGVGIEVAKMAQAYRNSVGVSRAIQRERASGHNRTVVSLAGTNNKVGPALQELVERQTNAYGRAKGRLKTRK